MGGASLGEEGGGTSWGRRVPGGDVTPPGPQESRVEGLWAEASRRSFRLSFRSHVGSCCIWWSGSCLDAVSNNFQIILSWLLKTIVGDTFLFLFTKASLLDESQARGVGSLSWSLGFSFLPTD